MSVHQARGANAEHWELLNGGGYAWSSLFLFCSLALLSKEGLLEGTFQLLAAHYGEGRREKGYLITISARSLLCLPLEG